MEVLETIISYMEGNSYLDTSQKEALEIFYNYCNHTEPQMDICEIDPSFFEEFLIYWLPKNESRLEAWEVNEVLKGLGGYCTYIHHLYKIPSLDKYKVMRAYKRECLRIYQLTNLFREYLGDPILNMDPLVIDFQGYKQYKSRKNAKDKNSVHQEGLFEVIEIDYDNTVIFRKIPRGNCVRVILTKDLILHMKKGDLLQFRIKQKQFFSLWEIEDLKNCYLPEASHYIRH